LSPHTRRARNASAGHPKAEPPRPAPARRAPGNPAGGRSAKPAPGPASLEAAGPPPDESDADLGFAEKPAPRRKAAPGASRRGLARVQRSSMLKSGYGYVREYIPLLGAFIVLFVGVWAWISFGPHTPSPKENWTRIESAWKPKRDADLQKIGASRNDFSAQLAAYKSLRDDTKGWMDELAAVKDWGDPALASAANSQVSLDVNAVVAAGQNEVTLLDQVAAATGANDVLALADSLSAAEQTFVGTYQTAYAGFYGAAIPSLGPSLALPSGSFVPSPSPGGSPSASQSPAPSTSASASASPSPASS
jgi:hypothetical protein